MTTKNLFEFNKIDNNNLAVECVFKGNTINVLYSAVNKMHAFALTERIPNVSDYDINEIMNFGISEETYMYHHCDVNELLEEVEFHGANDEYVHQIFYKDIDTPKDRRTSLVIAFFLLTLTLKKLQTYGFHESLTANEISVVHDFCDSFIEFAVASLEKVRYSSNKFKKNLDKAMDSKHVMILEGVISHGRPVIDVLQLPPIKRPSYMNQMIKDIIL